MGRISWRVLSVAAVAAAGGIRPLHAGPPPCATLVPAGQPSQWPAPLDRPVTIDAGVLPLREALDRVAAAGRFRLSYSAEVLPLDRAACLNVRDLPAGAALAALLHDTGVVPLVVSEALVVLPPPPREQRSEAVPATAAVELETIVVTGSATATTRRPLPLAMDVVTGADLRSFGGDLTQALSGTVPGLWLWPQGQTSVLSNYGSIRGTSSFGLSYPKVFIDGIEVANPLVLTGLAPEGVDRIEVIRGPQGATLYGAEAISGVMNIVTRQEGGEQGTRWRLESAVGAAHTAYASDPAFATRHALSARTGNNLTSGAVHLAGRYAGPVFPGASHGAVTGQGTFRHVGAGTIVQGIGRLSYERAEDAPSPLLPDSGVAGRRRRTSGTEEALGYTVGATLRVPRQRWTHSVMAGVDGYSLSGVTVDRSPLPSALDSALAAAAGGAVRGTARLGTTRHLALGAGSAGDVMLTGEHSVLRQWSDTATLRGGRGSASSTRSNSSVALTGSAGWRERVFLSGGGRVERTTGNDPVLVPTVGVAILVGGDQATLKLRGAYGKGVRWPTATARVTLLPRQGQVVSTTGLDPEEQAGVEGGADLFLWRGRVTLSLTRFDQVASGLIQRVGALDSAGGGGGGGPGGGGPPRVSYTLENVGEITNRGWEASANASHGPFSLTATWSTVASRVRTLARRYGGDLQPGDRMLEVPRQTMSLTGRWRGGPWSAAVSAARAADWVGYDRVALARDYASGQPLRDFVGLRLRNYWKTYDGTTRLRASVSRGFGERVTVTLSGENLLDEQRGEPDNLTVVPGRTVLVAARLEW